MDMLIVRLENPELTKPVDDLPVLINVGLSEATEKSEVNSAKLAYTTSDLNVSYLLRKTWPPAANWCLYLKSVNCKNI